MKKITSLKEIVGEEVYKVWTDMLTELVPDGRTQRLSVLIASMIKYASALHYKKHKKSLLLSEDSYDEDAFSQELLSLIYKLFDDAEVGYSRTNYHGEEYSVAEEAMYQYMCWYNMPWE